jgi:hypothetical protein
MVCVPADPKPWWIALGTTYTNVMEPPGSSAYVDDLSLTATIPDTTPPTTTVSGWAGRGWL